MDSLKHNLIHTNVHYFLSTLTPFYCNHAKFSFHCPIKFGHRRGEAKINTLLVVKGKDLVSQPN